jgi:hypothetical protein
MLPGTCSILQIQSEHLHNGSCKDDVLTQYDARHNQQQESCPLMAGSSHTHTHTHTRQTKADYLQLCCTQRNYFLPRGLLAYRTYIPASFIRNSCELKRTEGEKLTLYLGNVGIYTVGQWFIKCAPRIPMDPRPVPRGSVDTFL